MNFWDAIHEPVLTRARAPTGSKRPTIIQTAPYAGMGRCTEAEKLSALLDRAYQSMLDLSPEGRTMLGLDTGEHAAARARLDDKSPAGIRRNQDSLRQGLTELKAIDADRLTGMDPAARRLAAVNPRLATFRGAAIFGASARISAINCSPPRSIRAPTSSSPSSAPYT